MAESSPVPEEVKKGVRAVLLSKIGGVLLDKFSADYTKLTGHQLHYRELGFETLRAFLEAMPDAVRFQYSEEAGVWMLYGIGDPNSYMSSAAIKAQFSKPGDALKDGNKRKNRKRFNKSNNKDQNAPRNQTPKHDGDNKKRNGRATPRKETNNSEVGQRGDRAMSVGPSDHGAGELRLLKSHRGLYTVCVNYKSHLTESSKPIIMQEIVEMFATQGDVVEKACPKSLMFFRFQDEEEAIAVIQTYHGRILKDGTEIHVTPASEKMPSKDKEAGETLGRPQQSEIYREQKDLLMQYQRLAVASECGDSGEYWLEEQQVPMAVNTYEVRDPLANVMELCVFNLNKSITEMDLMFHFMMFNPQGARIKFKMDRNIKKYYAFVTFACIADACNAQAAYHESHLKGATIRVDIAKNKPHPPRTQEEGARGNETRSTPVKMGGRNKNKQGKWQRNSRSGDEESGDSISGEIGEDAFSPPLIHNEVPIVDDSPYAVRTHSAFSQKSELNEGGFGNVKHSGGAVGRGRGRLLANASPSLGRGLSMLANEQKKKLRPSLADLANIKLDEV